MIIAEYIVKLLREASIQRIWGVTGDSLNGLADSLKSDGSIQWIGVRHEEVAAFAAGAEAEVSQSLAVCAGSCGPGNMHLINGLYNCYRNQVPVLAIASDIPSTEIGTHYFQETDPKTLFSDCSVYCEKITTPEQMPQVFETAMRQALLKRSVSVVVLPGDIALKALPKETDIKWQTPSLPRLEPASEATQLAADYLNKAKRVTLLCGAGCQFAHSEILQLADILQSPVVHALRGKEFIEYDNPYSVGMTGLIGFESGYHAMEHADTLVLIGTGFPYRHFYPKNKTIIQIDHSPAAIGRHVQVDVGIVSDTIAALDALTPLLQRKTDDRFLKACLKHYTATRNQLDNLAEIKPKSHQIHPQTLAKTLSDLAAEDAIFTCDVGTPTLWSARYLQMNGQRRLIGSFNHGSMANALAMALGAQSTNSKRQVVAFCGDGGFSMLMGDLLTLLPYGLNIKIVVLNNQSLGFVDMEMKAAGFVSDSTKLDNPSFAEIARACGLKSDIATQPQELADKVSSLLNHDGPALLEVMTDHHELSMPPSINVQQVKGFSLYALKAIFNGYGDELVGIVKINLLR
ncbi:ubiquinone-dependent pyruvate dehydrogenase [Vibrio sp. DNB22_19_2]